jgi:hypothetical protein
MAGSRVDRLRHIAKDAAMNNCQSVAYLAALHSPPQAFPEVNSRSGSSFRPSNSNANRGTPALRPPERRGPHSRASVRRCHAMDASS